MSAEDERTRIIQSNDVAAIVQTHAEAFIPLQERYGIADALWAAGLRLPTPDPEEITPEAWASLVAEERDRQVALGYTPEHDESHGVRHLLNWAFDYARRVRALKVGAMIWAAMDVLDRRGYDESPRVPTNPADYEVVGDGQIVHAEPVVLGPWSETLGRYLPNLDGMIKPHGHDGPHGTRLGR